jgi:hypothetical protein
MLTRRGGGMFDADKKREGRCLMLTREGGRRQVFDVASEAGAEDIQPARDEDNAFLGFRVRHSPCLHTPLLYSLTYILTATLPYHTVL